MHCAWLIINTSAQIFRQGTHAPRKIACDVRVEDDGPKNREPKPRTEGSNARRGWQSRFPISPVLSIFRGLQFPSPRALWNWQSGSVIVQRDSATYTSISKAQQRRFGSRTMATFASLQDAPSQALDLCCDAPVTLCASTQTLPGRPRHPAPVWPEFGMTEDIRLEPIEREAVRILQSGDPPCQLDIERMFDMIPRSMLKYNDDASIYVAGGASPRCRDSLFTLSIDLPYFNFAVTRYLHWVAPAHKFTTFVLRRGVIGFPHRDTRNAPLPSLVQAFTTPDWERDGLWVQDRLGTVPKSHRGKLVFGRIQPLMMPFIFNARRLLHAGYVQDSSRRQERLILVAFCTIHASVLDGAY